MAVQTMDTDSDGRLSADEVAAGLRQLGHTFSTDDIRFMFSKVLFAAWGRAGEGKHVLLG
jgi:Ca2+-binding EF-hand superfamily protein